MVQSMKNRSRVWHRRNQKAVQSRKVFHLHPAVIQTLDKSSLFLQVLFHCAQDELKLVLFQNQAAHVTYLLLEDDVFLLLVDEGEEGDWIRLVVDHIEGDGGDGFNSHPFGPIFCAHCCRLVSAHLF